MIKDYIGRTHKQFMDDKIFYDLTYLADLKMHLFCQYYNDNGDRIDKFKDFSNRSNWYQKVAKSETSNTL